MRCTFKLFPFFLLCDEEIFFYIVDWMQLCCMYTKKNVILLENLSLQLDLWKLQMTFISVSNIKWVHVSIFVVFFVPEGGRLWKSGNLSFRSISSLSLLRLDMLSVNVASFLNTKSRCVMVATYCVLWYYGDSPGAAAAVAAGKGKN